MTWTPSFNKLWLRLRKLEYSVYLHINIKMAVNSGLDLNLWSQLLWTLTEEGGGGGGLHVYSECFLKQCNYISVNCIEQAFPQTGICGLKLTPVCWIHLGWDLLRSPHWVDLESSQAITILFVVSAGLSPEEIQFP